MQLKSLTIENLPLQDNTLPEDMRHALTEPSRAVGLPGVLTQGPQLVVAPGARNEAQVIVTCSQRVLVRVGHVGTVPGVKHAQQQDLTATGFYFVIYVCALW